MPDYTEEQVRVFYMEAARAASRPTTWRSTTTPRLAWWTRRKALPALGASLGVGRQGSGSRTGK